MYPNIRVIIVTLLLFFGLVPKTCGQQQFAKIGTAGGHFLSISPDARFAGMASSAVAILNRDASAVFYNPASLVYMQALSATFSNVQWFADISLIAAAVAYPVRGFGTFALHFRTLDTGEIGETTVFEQDGTGETYKWIDMATGLSYAIPLTDKFAFGANLYYITQNIDRYGYQASTWAVDMGTLYITGFRSLKLGMSVKNFGPELDFDKTFDDYDNGMLLPEPEPFRSFHMPLTFQVGISYELLEVSGLHNLIIAANAVHPNDSEERVNLGAEYNFMKFLFIRGGLYSNHDSATFMGGAGVKLKGISADYALSNYGLLDYVHQFTVTFSL